MKVLLILALGLVALASARPSEVLDIEQDNFNHEQEGQPGRAVEGEYSWVAPNGEEYHIKYVADSNGYRVVDDNVVPEFNDESPTGENDDE